MDKMHYQISLKGRVQGVWFRKYTKNVADRIGVKGTVENQEDGSVFVQAEGTSAVLSQFLEELKKGSPFSKVTEVNFATAEIIGFENFEIIR
jgi:acylphosphatase